jgi:hypothetical protein
MKKWVTPATATIMVDAKTAIDGNLHIPSTYQKDEMDLTGAKAVTGAVKIVITRKKYLILNIL